NNKLYLKVFDSNFNILTEKDFSVIDYEIRGVSIQFSRNSCYILSNIKNLYFNYKPYLIALDLDSLSTTISKNKISNNIISIFPNPAATKLTVNSETVIKEIYIYDLLGKLVKQINLENNKTKDTEIAIDELTAGIYFIQVVDEYDAKLSSKFIKE
ncbi:MAG: T9SS type A sorting domain-containing protein, partial [Bacteroidia bacterium]|nr:T9SS type A sorting domain-containing protein [Bacteroidia bacterium]